MFPGSTKDKLETIFLRSGRRFRSGERRKIVGGRQNSSLFVESEYGFGLHLDKGSCNEEEECKPIYEGEEELEESAETPK